MHALIISVLPFSLSVCRLEADCSIPGWASAGPFFAITRTSEELSVVCEAAMVPEGIRSESGWCALKVEGPLDFALTGILARLSGVLAEAEISIFALSTFDTDYILVREARLDAAVAALREAGYIVERYN